LFPELLPCASCNGYNFIAGDALITIPNAGGPFRTPWTPADVIIGNPPFIGAKLLKPQRGPDYVNALRKLYPEIPGMADYCVYWFRRAHDHLPLCTAEDPVSGRAGLVGTQNIRNNKSREGGLDYIVKSGTIVEAVDNQPWSGEANVHVSIANWIKSAPIDPRFTEREQSVTRAKLLIPEEKKLWSVTDPGTLPFKLKNRASGRKDKTYELTVSTCEQVSAALTDKTDVTSARILTCNTRPQVVYQGQVPGHEAFVLAPSVAKRLIKLRGLNREVLFPFLVGRDVVTGAGHPTRWVIDFQDIDVLAASRYAEPFELVEKHVLPDRRRKAEEGQDKEGGKRPHHQLFLRYWWRHSYDRPEMINSLKRIPRYIVCSGVTKRPIFNFISNSVRPDHAVFVFAFADDYSFGVLQSNAHWQWFVAKCSKLKSDFRYTPPSVFDTFPWPQCPAEQEILSVAKASCDVRRVRNEQLNKTTGGLRSVYRILELPGQNPLKIAHAALDAAVLKAYGFSAKKDILQQLLDLNLDVAARIGRGDAVTAPGIPPGFPHPKSLVTADCVSPAD
jgi:hypothetical protein